MEVETLIQCWCEIILKNNPFIFIVMIIIFTSVTLEKRDYSELTPRQICHHLWLKTNMWMSVIHESVSFLFLLTLSSPFLHFSLQNIFFPTPNWLGHILCRYILVQWFPLNNLVQVGFADFLFSCNYLSVHIILNIRLRLK